MVSTVSTVWRTAAPSAAESPRRIQLLGRLFVRLRDGYPPCQGTAFGLAPASPGVLGEITLLLRPPCEGRRARRAEGIIVDVSQRQLDRLVQIRAGYILLA